MNVNIIIPKSWDDLSQAQLKSVFKFLASDRLSLHQCKLLLAFKFAHIRFHAADDGGAVVRFNGLYLYLDENDLLAIAHSLDFIEDDPKYPVRLFELKHRKAVHPDLRDLSFAQWLAIENLYFGFLQTRDFSLLNEILSILYPKKGLFSKFVKSFKAQKIDYTHICAIKWINSLKSWLKKRYPELFKAVGDNSGDSPALSQMNIMESMNAQIRALTKGDITKKEEVLNMDLHSALTELDALALEARKLNELSKKFKSK